MCKIWLWNCWCIILITELLLRKRLSIPGSRRLKNRRRYSSSSMQWRNSQLGQQTISLTHFPNTASTQTKLGVLKWWDLEPAALRNSKSRARSLQYIQQKNKQLTKWARHRRSCQIFQWGIARVQKEGMLEFLQIAMKIIWNSCH